MLLRSIVVYSICVLLINLIYHISETEKLHVRERAEDLYKLYMVCTCRRLAVTNEI